ncbi:FTR1 family protein [Candidatus Woesearchaeota archaeon]|nr:FTR1 family protein [Candidatus Woesearchaeota archaeon]
MLESFLLTSRETLEASLVVGIVMAYLARTNNPQYKKNVYYGIIAGILLSIASAFIFTVIAGGFSGKGEEIFEGTTMLIGSFLLTTMILWMMRQRHISRHIESKVQKYVSHENGFFSHFGIFSLIFIAILREGVETVIFLNAASFSGGANFLGGTLGILAALITGYLFFMSALKINLRKLFGLSSILLILFAAGLVAHGIHEFEEAGLVSGLITPLFDINPPVRPDGSFSLLHENGIFGSFFKGMFGYNGNPSLLEVMAYLGYLGAILVLYLKIERDNRLGMKR